MKRNVKRENSKRLADQFLVACYLMGTAEADVVDVREIREVVHEQIDLFGSCRYSQR